MATTSAPPGKLTERFDEALVYAARLHKRQTRKDTDTPYLAHLLSVTALVLENGGDEDQAIAALLHDAAEDQGGLETLAEIHRRYGERVARIVEGCTDALEDPKPPWRPRKEAYLEHLLSAAPDVRLVSLADKLHNARTILTDLRQEGDGLWKRFRGGKAGSLWYYRALVETFRQVESSALVDELARVVDEIENLASRAG